MLLLEVWVPAVDKTMETTIFTLLKERHFSKWRRVRGEQREGRHGHRGPIWLL